MKTILVLLVVAPALLFSQKTTCSFSVMYTSQYCGGAAPSEEQLTALETPKPLLNSTFIIVKNKKIIDSAATGEKGQMRFKLKKGEYLVYESWRYNLGTPNGLDITSFDKNCLITEWQKPYARLVVTKRDFKVEVLNAIVKQCNWSLPCLSIELPVPPSAPPPSREN